MKTTKRMLALFLVMVTLCSVIAVPALAATSWPSLSSSGYCEMIAPGKINVYRDTALKTPGTCSPAKSYNAYVAKNDKVYILKVTGSYTMLSYPVSSGRRTGYVRTDALFGVTAPQENFTSKAKVTTYVSASTATKSGSTAVGDTIYKLRTNGNYVLIMYSAKSGSRAMKAAYVTKADYDKIKGTGSSSGNGSQNMSYALYKSSGGKLTCGFDGYVNTSGRHEGIDFKKGTGSSVYSLTDGVITRVTQGSRGSSGLSTIAVYSASAGKTVIYLHADPVDSLYVGQQISRGQLIAYEDWRGCSSSSGAHTHVEVRNGQKTAAAKSVNDPTLNNASPTGFWNSQGYQVK